MILGLEFPTIENLVEWPAGLFKGSDYFAFNKIALTYGLGFLITTVLFLIAGRQKGLVPRGVRNMIEAVVGFVEKQIMMPTIGPKGQKYLPLLVALFCFIFIGNITEVIPFFNMPANARMAGPLVLALVVWVTWIGVGIKAHGAGTFFKDSLFPPGVPKALYILVTPIEFLSQFFIRPLSHAVRLFANMLAGHILLVTFGVLCIALWVKKPLFIVNVPTFAMLVALTAFEMAVAFLQAFVFAILTGVYIGGSLTGHGGHDDHH